MTDSPPPSGRPESAKTALFVLLRPVVFAVGAIGLTLGALVLLHKGSPPPPVPVQVAETPVILPDPDPAPAVTDADFKSFGSNDFKGFQAGPPPGQPGQPPQQAQQSADSGPPAPDRYQLPLRLEKGDSSVMWGDFQTHLTGTDFIQFSRTLYGLNIRYRSPETTTVGEKKTSVDAFWADPGTLEARQEFRGTGGSLYYLQNQDISVGSEQVWMQVRDRDSGLVLSVTPLE